MQALADAALGESVLEARPVAVASAFAGAGVASTAALLVRPRAGIRAVVARGVPAGVRAAGACLTCAGLVALLAFAVSDPGPRRPWRSGPTAAPARGSSSARPPNLVLISIDTLRSDHVGAYGYERETTPVLDEAAEQGALFEAFISTAPWTLPSHSALFTGRYPAELDGYRVRGTPSLATILQAEGYQTAAFTAGYVMGRDHFGEGFDFFAGDYEDAYVYGFWPVFLKGVLRVRRGLRHLGLGIPVLNPINHWRGSEGRSTSAFAGARPGAEAAAAWIRDRGGRGPFCLLYHTFAAHEYYLNTANMRALADDWEPGYEG